MEVFVDNSFKEGVDRAKEAAALRNENAIRKFGGDKVAARAWLNRKNAMKQPSRGR